MNVLTVPNWSFGRDRDLLMRFEEVLATPNDEGETLTVHYLQGDIDHNRTVSAFSGPMDLVFSRLEWLCEEAFPRIDLTRHVGVHPRIGALDVCPMVLIPGPGPAVSLPELNERIERWASSIARRFDLPIYLYEKSERGRHEADLPSLRRGGFGALLERELDPDLGPPRAHERLGVTVMGARDFLIAMNVNLATEDLDVARRIARTIRERRAEGDPDFLGIRALGFYLRSQACTQVSLNLTLPDLTAPDSVIEWIELEAGKRGATVARTELIGVIRDLDLPRATRLKIDPRQIVPMSPHVSSSDLA
ncbi:MAG TPA: hypothetical protein PLO61_06225 [Fimbriimonadaceae bacterium]|nr:hypothetical protein [Fimbriimonadaceae bacterium]HRJ33153.1 hypothetical protein [Fimbriimonadaceae bacterium]